MKEFHPENIRNIAFIGHQGSGKTTLIEALLYRLGVTSRMGSVEEGNTQSDYRADEISRRMSIAMTLLVAEGSGEAGSGEVKSPLTSLLKLNLIDTPGFTDFQGEVICGLRACDTAVMLINATAGVEVGTDLFSDLCVIENRPLAFFINQLDKEHTDFEKTYRELEEEYQKTAPLVLPLDVGSARFHQVIDLLHMKLYTYASNGTCQVSEIPTQYQSTAQEWRVKLMERCAETDDALMESYFSNDTLSTEELVKGLRLGLVSRTLYPVLAGAAKSQVGVAQLIHFFRDIAPSPVDLPPKRAKMEDGEKWVEINHSTDEPLIAQIFKTISEPHIGDLSFFRVYHGVIVSGSELKNTTRNVMEKIGQIFIVSGRNRKNVDEVPAGDIGALVKLKDTHTGDTLCSPQKSYQLPSFQFPEPVARTAVVPRNRGDEERISNALHILAEEDPTFRFHYDPELSQLIVEGQGELHLNVIIDRLKERFNVEVDLEEPKIPYRETIKGTAEGQGKYKRQTGGRGQYGDCWLRLEPLPRGGDFEFVDAIVGGVIPGKYIPAVEKGVRGAMAEGVIAGYPVIDVKVTVYDGSHHPVDSSENAFKVAASLGFKKVFKEARPVILEPIYDLEVRIPEENLGDVMGDISARRGKILGMERDGRFQVIRAKVPLAELNKYASSLRSLTGGRGFFKQKFSHYEEVPGEVQNRLVAEYEARKAKGFEEE